MVFIPPPSGLKGEAAKGAVRLMGQGDWTLETAPSGKGIIKAHSTLSNNFLYTLNINKHDSWDITKPKLVLDHSYTITYPTASLTSASLLLLPPAAPLLMPFFISWMNASFLRTRNISPEGTTRNSWSSQRLSWWNGGEEEELHLPALQTWCRQQCKVDG